MKRSPIRKISKKKAIEIRREKPIRKRLYERADGCCEYCGKPEDMFGLHPHEKVFRSAGGKLSMGNSIILCQACHDLAQRRLIKFKEVKDGETQTKETSTQENKW